MDVDGDGDGDLVACGFNDFGVAVFENRDGVLAEPVYFAVAGTLLAIAAGDVDLDRDLDLVLGESGESAVVFVRNDGGVFEDAGRWIVGAGTAAPTITDFTRDGVPDVVASAAGCTLMPNLGGPGGVDFSEQAVYAAGPSPAHFETGDLNGDGDVYKRQNLARAISPAPRRPRRSRSARW